MLVNKFNWPRLGDLFKKNIKNDNHYAVWRLVSIGMMGFLGLIIIVTIYFIYNNIYNTISNSNAILILSSNSQNDIVDVGSYDQAKKIISKKEQAMLIPNKLRNIFDYGQELTKPVASSTKK